MSKKIYTVKFPLEIGVDQVGYSPVSEIKDTIEYNIKSTLLTSPGEIISDPDFGVGLKRAIFEQQSPDLLSSIRRKIVTQLATYVPYIQVINVSLAFPPDSNQIDLSIRYRISASQTQETFNFSVDMTDI